MSERDEFEAWAEPQGILLGRVVSDDRYESMTTEWAYRAWQAARAPQAVPALTLTLTDEDIERQYEDGICLGSGIRRETCPCGFCRKYRTPRQLAAPQPSTEKAAGPGELLGFRVVIDESMPAGSMELRYPKYQD